MKNTHKLIAQFKGNYQQKYGQDFLFDVVDNHFVVLTEVIAEELRKLLTGHSVLVESVEESAGIECQISQLTNLYTRRRSELEYLADQIGPGEQIRIYKPVDGQWAPVVIHHSFEKIAPKELGWIKFDKDKVKRLTKPKVRTNHYKSQYRKEGFIEIVKSYLSVNSGIKYFLGGKSYQLGFDCSSFVQMVFFELTNLWLPRLSRWQVLIGREVDRQKIRIGDVAYFDDLELKRVGHLGFIVSLLDDKIQIAHCTRYKNGVVVQNLEEIVDPNKHLQFAGFRRFL